LKDFLISLYFAGPGTVVLYEKTTTTDMNSTYEGSVSTASDEELGTVNYYILFIKIVY